MRQAIQVKPNSSNKQETLAPPKISTLQRRLSVSAPGDPLEEEADRIADRLVGFRSGSMFNAISSMGGFHPTQAIGNASKHALGVHPKHAGNGPIQVDASQLPTKGGAELPLSVRKDFEPRLGYDLSQVRIHSDSEASHSARSLNAVAYATGNHLVFGEGKYSPNTVAGRRLLAHELAHVIQQGSAAPLASIEAGYRPKNMSPGPSQWIQCTFEDEPISTGEHADTLVTRIQGILREWKSECQEGVNDFVHAELAAAIDRLGSGSWPGFLTSLLGNTIWAGTAFFPGAAPTALFGMSMLGIAVSAIPSIPSASSEGANLIVISDLLKNYFGNVFNQLMDRANPGVRAYLRSHGSSTGNQALIDYLRETFRASNIDITGTPNINGNAVRMATRSHAADLLNRYRRQVVPLGPETRTNITDPIDRQIRQQTGLVWALHPNGTAYLVQIDISSSFVSGRLDRSTAITFRTFVDSDLRSVAIARALPNQPNGIQTLPWSLITHIPTAAPASTAHQ